MKLHPESHLDHALTQAQIDYLVGLFADRDGFFIETIELPEALGSVPCGLYGPIMGDAPVTDDEVIHGTRGARTWESRLVERHARLTRRVTLIAGPHGEESCILYTSFGGPLAPQEPGDPGCKDVAASKAFWSEHALATLAYDSSIGGAA